MTLFKTPTAISSVVTKARHTRTVRAAIGVESNVSNAKYARPSRKPISLGNHIKIGPSATYKLKAASIVVNEDIGMEGFIELAVKNKTDEARTITTDSPIIHRIIEDRFTLEFCTPLVIFLTKSFVLGVIDTINSIRNIITKNIKRLSLSERRNLGITVSSLRIRYAAIVHKIRPAIEVIAASHASAFRILPVGAPARLYKNTLPIAYHIDPGIFRATADIVNTLKSKQ